MAGTVTLSTLRTLVRQRADMVSGSNGSGGFVSDSELNYYINAASAELYDILVTNYEDQYTEELAFTITSGSTADLGGGFLKLVGLDYLDGSDYFEVPRFEWRERNRRANPSTYFQDGVCRDRKYRVVNNTLHIIPTDDATGTYRLWYVPAFVDMVSDADALDAIQVWYEYVVVDAAIRCLAKEESDVSVHMAMKEALKRRIESAADNRDANSPQVVRSRWDGYGDGY